MEEGQWSAGEEEERTGGGSALRTGVGSAQEGAGPQDWGGAHRRGERSGPGRAHGRRAVLRTRDGALRRGGGARRKGESTGPGPRCTGWGGAHSAAEQCTGAGQGAQKGRVHRMDAGPTGWGLGTQDWGGLGWEVEGGLGQSWGPVTGATGRAVWVCVAATTYTLQDE